MWLKLSIITLLFYFLGLVQNSFFSHFNILGAVPNFIFIIFFIIIFFSPREKIYSWESLFYYFIAGLFLDIFYYSFFGISFITLLAISIIFKKIFNSLKQKKDKHLFVYFAPLFFIFLIVFETLSGICLYFFSVSGMPLISWMFLAKIIYSFVFAAIGFYTMRRLQKVFKSNRSNLYDK